jgi:hypothetical protein
LAPNQNPVSNPNCGLKDAERDKKEKDELLRKSFPKLCLVTETETRN